MGEDVMLISILAQFRFSVKKRLMPREWQFEKGQHKPKNESNSSSSSFEGESFENQLSNEGADWGDRKFRFVRSHPPAGDLKDPAPKLN
jgi:hypothetical protein